VVQRQIMETLGNVQKEIGAAIILIGHDMGLMAQFVDRLGVMYGGKLVEDGETKEAFRAPPTPLHEDPDRQPALVRRGAAAGEDDGAAALADCAAAAWLRVPSPVPQAVRAVRLGRATAGRPVEGHSGRRACSTNRPFRQWTTGGAPVMSSLLDMRAVTKIFGSGEGATRALSDFSHAIDDDTADHHRDRRRKRQRQEHRGAVDPRVREADLRSGALPAVRICNRSAGLSAKRFRQEVQAICQDPFGVYNPFYIGRSPALHAGEVLQAGQEPRRRDRERSAGLAHGRV